MLRYVQNTTLEEYEVGNHYFSIIIILNKHYQMLSINTTNSKATIKTAKESP